jgi:hypothetical protein
MKYIFAICLLVLSLSTVSSALSIFEGSADAFVLIQELGPSGNYGDFKPIGGGTIVEIADYNESFLLTKPAYLTNRDSIFINFIGVTAFHDKNIYPIRLKEKDIPIWSALRDSQFDIAVIPLKGLWAVDIVAIDTSRLYPVDNIHVGEDILYFDFVNLVHLRGEWHYPVARRSIVSFVPREDCCDGDSNGGNFITDNVFYIDGSIPPGAVGSPVFSAPKDSTGYPSLIGILQGPYKGPNGDQNLGVVAPTEAIIKLLNIYHGCEK